MTRTRTTTPRSPPGSADTAGGGESGAVECPDGRVRFDEMLTHILVVLVLIVAVDQLSAAVRRRLAT